jgi:hypothetical protein
MFLVFAQFLEEISTLISHHLLVCFLIYPLFSKFGLEGLMVGRLGVFSLEFADSFEFEEFSIV